MGGAPLLTENEAFEMGQSFESDEERKQYATMLSALRNLCGCIEETHVKYLEVMVLLTFLGGFFGRAKEYRNFQNLLDELCLKRDGEYSKRLQERIVTTRGLLPYFYNIELEEESDNSKHISLKLSEDELALA